MCVLFSVCGHWCKIPPLSLTHHIQDIHCYGGSALESSHELFLWSPDPCGEYNQGVWSTSACVLMEQRSSFKITIEIFLVYIDKISVLIQSWCFIQYTIFASITLTLSGKDAVLSLFLLIIYWHWCDILSPHSSNLKNCNGQMSQTCFFFTPFTFISNRVCNILPPCKFQS